MGKISIILFLCKVARKLHLNKIMYLVAKFFAHDKIQYNETTIMRTRKVLSDLCPNPNNSCIYNDNSNLCNYKFDLQVIVPAYNTAKYIKRCIDSVLSLPTSRNIIVTVVNDGSTDNTGEILLQYMTDSRVEIITQENRGFSGARNRGLDNIKARYITFLDSDDEFLQGTKIDYLLSMAENSNVDILECGHITFNDDGDKQIIRHKNLVSDKANGLLYGFPWGKFFRSELFSNIRFPEGYWFEDTVMAFVIFPMCKKVATSSELLYHYRINPEGITSKSRGNIKSLDTYWITEQLLSDREVIGLPNDCTFANEMLKQIRMNYNRLKGINNLDIDRYVFILTTHLWKKYFHEVNTNSRLAAALMKHDFLQYLLLIELEQ